MVSDGIGWYGSGEYDGSFQLILMTGTEWLWTIVGDVADLLDSSWLGWIATLWSAKNWELGPRETGQQTLAWYMRVACDGMMMVVELGYPEGGPLVM